LSDHPKVFLSGIRLIQDVKFLVFEINATETVGASIEVPAEFAIMTF
jgi:hypothetical protein